MRGARVRARRPCLRACFPLRVSVCRRARLRVCAALSGRGDVCRRSTARERSVLDMQREKRPRITLPQMVVCPSPSVAVGVGEEDAKTKGEVGRMVDCSQADDRRLIRLVRERRLLYARNNMPVASFYTQVKALWDEVAVAMGWTVADVRRKWSHIRNSYSRHLRNEMHGACTSKGRMVSRWYLADELEFLREHMATDMRSSPYSSYAPTMLEMDMSETSTPEPADVKPFIPSPWFALSGGAHSPKPEPRTPRAPSLLNDDSSGSFAPDENSSYFQFFRGIHNDYLELPAKKQRLFKRKCLTLLHELLDDEESQQASDYNNDNTSVLNLSNSAQYDNDKDQKPHIEDNFILPNN